MNILLLDHFNRHGGAQEYGIDLAHKFNEMGHRCYLPTVENETLADLAKGIPKIDCSLFMRGVAGFLPFFKICKKLKKELVSKEIDIIHCNSIPSLPFAKWVSKKMPVVYTAHDCNLVYAKRFLIKHCANFVISVSQTVQDNLKNLGVNLPNRVIYNGLFDFSIDRSCREKTVFGVAGRIEKTKGIDVFVDAATRVVDTFPDSEFHIIGYSEDEEYFNVLQAKSVGIPQIKFRPFCSSKSELYSSIDVLVNCSRYCEPLGRTLIEAGIVSMPAIGPGRCGPAEIIDDGFSGLLFESENSESLAGAFEKFLEDRSLMTTLGEGGRTVYERTFTIDKIATEVLALYAELIE